MTTSLITRTPAPSGHTSTRRSSHTRVAPSAASTAAETTDLLRRAAAADTEEERSLLLNEVVVLNMPYARSIASRYANRGIASEDLEQVAYLALIKAARGYRAELAPGSFLPYMVTTVRGELKKHFRDLGWAIRPPRRTQELQARIFAIRADLTQQTGRSPRIAELAEAVAAPEEEVIEALVATDFHTVSLDRPVGGDGGDTTLGDLLPLDSSDLARSEAMLTLAPLIRRLSERDRRLLGLRFFHGATQEEIAKDIGVTQMHVSRLLSRLLAELRRELTKSGPSGHLPPAA